MLPHHRWQARIAREKHEVKVLDRVFPMTPSGWSKRTPRPVSDNGVCKLVFDGKGLRLMASCPPTQENWWKHRGEEVIVITLICVDGCAPTESQRGMAQEDFFPLRAREIKPIDKSPAGVFTYHLPVAVVD